MASEKEIIAQILNGHPERYSYFVSSYAGRIISFIMRLVGDKQDAEELAQDTLLDAYRNLSHYDTDRSFLTWTLKIAFNKSMNFLRKRKIQPLSIDDLINENISEQQVDSFLDADDDDRAKALIDAIAKLPPEEQTLIANFYYDGMKTSEIAYIMGIETGTVATRLHRIRKKLYILLKGKNE